MKHRESRLYRSLLSRLEDCKSILKSSLRDLPSINKYQKTGSTDDLSRRLAFLMKEVDKTFFELESRYKEEQRRQRKEREAKNANL